MNNKNFKGCEFATFKNEADSNKFKMSLQKWIKETNAIGIVSKSGRYDGGTFAHPDIAFEFASWLSPEFKLYLIKEFKRLKSNESYQQKIEWHANRLLYKLNYVVHTDAVKNYIVATLTEEQKKICIC
ncbi:MAG TPA: KilA-N domain-containing protein [Bacilli bacterium]|nr:KilA-N domain-containing protein [Bacilli bacterium]